MVKGSDLLIEALSYEGVDRVFGVPGEENLDLLESLRNSKIEWVLTRHEQAAAFMAATYGRFTGQPGVCVAACGPGALNLSTGAAYAYLGAMPMVMITGQKAILSSGEGRFQLLDVIALTKPITKLSRQIVSSTSIPSLVRDAFRIAMEERPGPVHLELPEDIAAGETEAVPMVPIHPIEMPVAHPGALARAAKITLESKRPLIMLGAAASRPRSSFGIASFVHRTGIPFFTTQMGKSAISVDTSLYMGTAALSARDYVHQAINQADLIIAIGHDTIEKPPFIMGPKPPHVIHVNYTPATVEQVYFPQTEIIGDIGQSLELLADRVEGKLSNAKALLSLRQSILDRVADQATERCWPLKPQRLVHDVRKVIPENGIVALDNGMYKIWWARNYSTYGTSTLLLDNALATMGAGLPSAMVAAMLYPDRRVMAICGDGGFMMNSQELETAVRLKLNLVVLILNDGAYGMIRWKQAARNLSDFGLAFGNPDFVRYAESFGAKGARVMSVEALVPTLEAAFMEGGVHLVDVPIDYSDTRLPVDRLCDR
ncbi:acetolactate synthase large subunit [Bradyrhizobium brasilense]|uniref:acetolactate synthase large subunit n=1 Tax=Bradyrhizobium brasilense TaxID=1419277 RepID=UPI000B8323E6|nr:acetolactate synthase large subunit [Bradyrhizobium brasilense]